MIPFDEYAPDQAALGFRGATVARNVVPRTLGSYGPLPALSVFSSNALGARCQGAYANRALDGVSYNWSGDATKLYRLVDTTWTDVSKPATTYGVGADQLWRFTQFGTRVIATNINNPIQSFNVSGGTTFVDLAAAAPKARAIATVEPGFVMVGNLNDGSYVPNRVQWCAIDDPTNWPTPGTSAAAAVQSDRQELPTGGAVQDIIGAVGAAEGVVFLENAIYRMDYAGAPAIFEFHEVERARGTPAPYSVISVGPLAFYLGEDGFYAFDGAQSAPIGANKIDRTFFAELDQQFYHRITVAADPLSKIVVWSYPASGSGGNPNRLLIYNWELQRWASGEAAVELIYRSLGTGYTLEGLNAVSATLEGLPVSLDARAWVGGNSLLSAFDNSHKLNLFAGANLAAELETGELDGEGRRFFVRGLRPIVDGGTVTTQVGYRDGPSGVPSYTSASGIGADGTCPHRVAARHVRARVAIAAGGIWSHAQGVEPALTVEGAR